MAKKQVFLVWGRGKACKSRQNLVIKPYRLAFLDLKVMLFAKQQQKIRRFDASGATDEDKAHGTASRPFPRPDALTAAQLQAAENPNWRH